MNWLKENLVVLCVAMVAVLVFCFTTVAENNERRLIREQVRQQVIRDERVAAVNAHVAEFFVVIEQGEPTIQFRYFAPKEIAGRQLIEDADIKPAELSKRMAEEIINKKKQFSETVPLIELSKSKKTKHDLSIQVGVRANDITWTVLPPMISWLPHFEMKIPGAIVLNAVNELPPAGLIDP